MIPSGACKVPWFDPPIGMSCNAKRRKCTKFETQAYLLGMVTQRKGPPSSPVRGECYKNSQTSETRQLFWTHGIVMFSFRHSGLFRSVPGARVPEAPGSLDSFSL